MDRVPYLSGFTSLDAEVDARELTVDGELPHWLSGDLIRNGPAKFETGRSAFRHWFDGQAMLHRFTIADGKVHYRNKFLDTPGMSAVRENRISYPEFATDPCKSIFGRMFTKLRRRTSANACVNVTSMGGESVALTETPIAVQFDQETLETVGVTGYRDDLDGRVTTAHPHRAPKTGDLVNYLLKFGRQSAYQVYRQRAGSMERELIASIPDQQPGYLHSFAVTENHVVLALFPFVVNPIALLLRDRPFIANYRWRPELGTRFVVIDLADGRVRDHYRTTAFFAFHHINAYEDGGELVLDVCAYPDAEVIDAWYLHRLRAGTTTPLSVPTRYRIDLDGGDVHTEALSGESMELPRIAYGTHNGRRHRYVYGVGATDDGRDFLNQLVKLDVRTHRTDIWRETGTYPGEPVFVARPGAVDEDDGVVLSVVLDAAANGSALLVLDARTWREVARASVEHVVPFGFHGQFTKR